MINPIDRTELIRLIEDDKALVVDVLPEREYDEGHIPGAVNLPLKQLTSETASILDQTRSVVVYCHDGL